MKKSIWIFSIFLGIFLLNPAVASAAGGEVESIGATLPIFFCIPFLGMLLCIAICPLAAGEWWEKAKPFVVAFWSLAFIIPFAVFKGADVALEQVLDAVIGDYITFIILLFGLFCVTGNICFEGDLVGKPKLNVLLLLIGTLLSSWIGTTGASMVMIRPLIRANKWRHRRAHIIIFFIFLVSNMGGCLTPVGDPPLLMGFMWGVGFFWSLHILPIMLLNTVLLLGLFYFMDKRAYKRDVEDGDKPGKPKEKTPVHLTGGHNIIFLAMIVLAIILSGMLPDIVPFFGREVKIYGEVSLTVASIMESVVILLAAFLSFKTTKKEVRVSNNFTWGPISEVAVLFIGIFITMIPAILILEAKGSSLGITQPWQFFWCTGLLSSFLDNTPTYMVFFATAASLGLTDGSLIATSLGMIPQVILAAVSAGAVFMGAVTYIGNAPNFMVRSIAEENGINMPSFFKYIIWSVSCLFPVFLIDTILFFL